jgi:hypothetical protein
MVPDSVDILSPEKIALTQRRREKEPTLRNNLMFVVNRIINLSDMLYVIILSHHICPFVPLVLTSEGEK